MQKNCRPGTYAMTIVLSQRSNLFEDFHPVLTLDASNLNTGCKKASGLSKNWWNQIKPVKSMNGEAKYITRKSASEEHKTLQNKLLSSRNTWAVNHMSLERSWSPVFLSKKWFVKMKFLQKVAAILVKECQAVQTSNNPLNLPISSTQRKMELKNKGEML